MLIGALAAVPAAAASWYVDASRPDDLGDGASWATAKKTLQAAYAAASAGDSIFVAAGAYCGVHVQKDDLAFLGGYPTGGGARNPALHVSTIGQCDSLLFSAFRVSARGVRVDGFRFTDTSGGEADRLVWVSGGQDFVFVNNLVEGLHVRVGAGSAEICPYVDIFSCIHSAEDAGGLVAHHAAGLRVQGNVFRNISVAMTPAVTDDGCCAAYQYQPVLKGGAGRSASAVRVVDSCNILIEANAIDDIRGGKGGNVHVNAGTPCYAYTYEGGNGGGAFGMVFTRSGGIVVENTATNLLAGAGGVVCAAAEANCSGCASPSSPGAAGASAPVFVPESDPLCPLTGGPSLHITASNIQDCGNQNGAPDRGETVSWYLTLTNSGTEAAYHATSAALTALSSAVNLLASETHYTTPEAPFVAVGESRPSVSPFIYRLHPSAPFASSHDFILTVKATTAAGYPYEKDIPVSVTVGDFGIVPLAVADFQAGLPAGWTVLDGYGDGVTWRHVAPFTPPPNPMGDPHAGILADPMGWDGYVDESLLSPVMDASLHQNVQLSFDVAYSFYDPFSDFLWVSVRSSLTGGEWVTVYTSDYQPEPARKTLDISAYAAGASDVEARWHVSGYFALYGDEYDTYAAVNNVRIEGRKMADNPADCDSSPVSARDILAGTVVAHPAGPIAPGVSAALLQWSGACAPSGNEDFVVYVGDLEMLRATGGDYAAANVRAVTCTTGGESARLCPAPESTVFYLVGVLEGDVVEGSLGRDSDDNLRPQGPAPCRPRRTAPCE